MNFFKYSCYATNIRVIELVDDLTQIVPEEDEKCSRIFNRKVEKTRQFCVRCRTVGL
jgi:hypothetical protein